MTKIMLVEDDKSLREIYGVRLLAEGYDIVTASDGEEALAIAIKERPALIISDVMMPKISGFDMLDILRSTSETKDIKVIMMTALSSEDQRQRGEQMGADRYLVKSQVGIEDVVRVVHEVLGDAPVAAPSAASPTTPGASAPPTVAPVAAPAMPAPTAQPTPQPPRPQQPIAVPPRPVAPMPQTPGAPAPLPIAPPHPTATPVMPMQPGPVMPAQPPAAPQTPQTSLTSPSAPSTRQRTIQPISSQETKVDINELLDRELAKEAGINLNNRPPVESTSQEKAEVQNQLNNYATRPVNGAPQMPMQPGQPHAVTNLAPPQTPPSPTIGGPNPLAPPPPQPPASLPPQP